MIKFKDISIGFSELLFEIKNLQLEKGKLIVLIGPNGAGKTTFFNTLLGNQPELAGQIDLWGKPLKDHSVKEKTTTFGFVPSRFAGVQHLSVRELIAMGRAPYTNILNRLNKEDIRIVDEVVRQLGLEDLQHKSSVEVSDGERQIAMIGKAITQSTSVILLDEPTAFLDYSNRKKVLKLLSNLASIEDKLIVVSSHDIELCMEYADEIIAVDNQHKKLLKFNSPFDKKEIIGLIFD